MNAKRLQNHYVRGSASDKASPLASIPSTVAVKKNDIMKLSEVCCNIHTPTWAWLSAQSVEEQKSIVAPALQYVHQLRRGTSNDQDFRWTRVGEATRGFVCA